MIQATRISLPVVDEDELYLFINFEDKRDVKNNLKKIATRILLPFDSAIKL